MIVNSLLTSLDDLDIMHVTDRHKNMVYEMSSETVDHVMSLTVPGSVFFLFSGSWRLNIDAVYLELKAFEKCHLKWHQNTWFVEPEQKNFYKYLLDKVHPDNLIILHSDYWCAHRPIDHIMTDISNLKKFSSRVICSIPIRHLNFNKMIMSLSDLCEQIDASVYDESLIIVR